MVTNKGKGNKQCNHAKQANTNLEFSFAAGGWLQFYLFGVAKCLCDHELNKNCRAVGCSAGSLAAAGVTVGGNFQKAVDFCKTTLIPECRRDIHGPFKISQYISRCLDISSDLSKFKKGNGKLSIQITSVPSLKGVRVSNFLSAEDLKTTLLASCAASPLSPFFRRVDGKLYTDGSLSDIQPLLSKNTITISPIYFWNADIKPSRYVPCHWAVLPPKDPATIDWLFDLGYKDCLDWMSKNGHCCVHSNVKDIFTCALRPKRSPHKYDEHQKSSFQRFFGYGPSCPLMDFLTIFWRQVLWKPLAVLLIWFELTILALLSALKATALELLPVLPLMLMVCTIVFPNTLESLVLLFSIAVAKLTLCGFSDFNKWKNTFNYIKALCAPELYLRSLPIFGMYFTLQQDLQQQSLIYRITMHFI